MRFYYLLAGLPEQSLREINQEIQELKDRIRANDDNLFRLDKTYGALHLLQAKALDQVRFLEARNGLLTSGPISGLQGYCPEDRIDGLIKAAQKNGWSYSSRDVVEQDRAPTLLRNARWIQIIEPVFRFMGIQPGYFEPDSSRAFLLFFSLFFGLIVGDAGYGILLLLVAFGGGLAMAASAWYQGRTGQGFGNYLFTIGVVETVALFVLVFIQTTL